MSFAPRVLRMSDAPAYLGMCRAEFNRCVRPHVAEFPIGVQGIGFDREELDEWANEYIVEHAIDKPQGGQEDGLGNERPQPKGGNKWGCYFAERDRSFRGSVTDGEMLHE